MSNRHKQLAEQLLIVRPTTRDLVTSILMDSWPGHAAIVDFGIDSDKHYEALYFPIREALGHGEKLTTLTREAASNPHKDVQFHTSWDLIFGRESAGRSPSDRGSGQHHGASKAPAQENGREWEWGIER
jgi:tRNA(Leu) C34 or U34 (ribose-2'-O)-methylase TrmL